MHYNIFVIATRCHHRIKQNHIPTVPQANTNHMILNYKFDLFVAVITPQAHPYINLFITNLKSIKTLKSKKSKIIKLN